MLAESVWVANGQSCEKERQKEKMKIKEKESETQVKDQKKK